MERYTGSCSCGAVHIVATGAPNRVGICHCLECRKNTGSLFHAAALFPSDAVTTTGDTKEYEGRSFCPICSSTVFGDHVDEMSVNLGCLDAMDQLEPIYELWTVRRESRLPEFPLRHRFAGDRE